MKVLFLDIDGPMIPSRAAILSLSNLWNKFDPVAVAHLNEIISKGVRIVISSSWRHMGLSMITTVLSLNGISPRCLHTDWRTISLTGVDDIDKENFKEIKRREDTILDWLKRNKNIDRWVAVDDMDLDLPEANFVRVSCADGILTNHINQIHSKLWLKDDELRSAKWLKDNIEGV